MLRKIFGPRRGEVTGEWRRMNNEDLNDLYTSTNIVRVIKSRRMGWSGHVVRIGGGEGGVRVLVRKSREGYHWGGLGVDGRIILRWIFRKWDVGVCMGSSWLRIGSGGRHL